MYLLMVHNMPEWRDLARSNHGLFRYYHSICLERVQKPWPTSVRIASVQNKLQTLHLTNIQWNKNTVSYPNEWSRIMPQTRRLSWCELSQMSQYMVMDACSTWAEYFSNRVNHRVNFLLSWKYKCCMPTVIPALWHSQVLIFQYQQTTRRRQSRNSFATNKGTNFFELKCF